MLYTDGLVMVGTIAECEVLYATCLSLQCVIDMAIAASLLPALGLDI